MQCKRSEMEGRGTLFREIHKNTWLKRVTADNRKIPVGTKVCIWIFQVSNLKKINKIT